MGYVDLPAFEKAVVNCQTVVSTMSKQTESLRAALSDLKIGIIHENASVMYERCNSCAMNVDAILNSIKKVLNNIDQEKQITARRLGANALD